MIRPGCTLGILGGGQLGRMIAMAAAQLGLKTHIYAPEENSPAFEVATEITIAPYEDEANLVRTPHSLDDVQAAGIPVAAVAAWQSLHHAGPIAAGQRILIHGAAGGLGGYAVQYARRAGAEVFATASTAHIGYVRSLGAAHVIDYRSERFESVARDIDLVLDYVGGDVLDRSWQVLAKDGAIVGTSSPDILARTPPGRRGLWFMNKADAPLLERQSGIVSAVQHERRRRDAR